MVLILKQLNNFKMPLLLGINYYKIIGQFIFQIIFHFVASENKVRKLLMNLILKQKKYKI